MEKIFGVDSFLPSNTKLSNGYDLYSWVMRMNCFPAFWGRNISGKNHVTQEEIDFLHEKNCRVALIFNDITEADVSRVKGTDDALRAINAVRSLGIIENLGIAIFAYIDPSWSISHNWMISFADAISKNGFVPGFIGNTDSSKNFNFDRQYGHFYHATIDRRNYNAVVWAMEPKVDGEPEEWIPYCPSDCTPDQIDLWQTGKINYREKKVNVSYARKEEVLKLMW